MQLPPVSIEHPRRAPKTAYRRITHLLTVLIWHGAVFVALRVYKTARGRITSLRLGKDGSRPHNTPSGRFLRLPAAERHASPAPRSGVRVHALVRHLLLDEVSRLNLSQLLLPPLRQSRSDNAPQ